MTLLAGLAVLLALASPHAASAQSGPWLVVTQCDSVSVDGQRLQRVSFSLTGWWLGFDNLAVRPVSPALGDTCRILSVSAPDGWTADLEPETGGAYWFGTPFGPNPTRDGFEIVLSGPSCCFEFSACPVVLDPCSGGTVCFQCPSATDIPVPALPRSWGALKVQYR